MSTEITKGKLLKNDHVIIEYQQRDSQDAEPANCTYDQKGTPRNSGRSLNFNTPILSLDDDSETAYPFTEELQAALDVCEDELTQYLNGVRAENPQGKLALQD